MAIVVQKVLSGGDGKWSVEVTHGDKLLTVTLKAESARELVGKYIFIELEVGRIVSVKKTTAASGIFVLPEGRHLLVGEIQDEMELGEGTRLYDLFIEPGPDYLALDSHDLGDVLLHPGDRVAVEVEGLSFSLSTP